MDLKRYFTVPVILTDDKTIIPLWDDKVKCEKDEYTSWSAYLPNNNFRKQNIVEAIYDIKKKIFSLGTEVDYYPEKTLFNEGEEILYQTQKYDEWGLSKIQKVVFEDYDLYITKGKKLENWIKHVIEKTGTVDKDMLYCIKEWKPFYLLENGELIKWEHQIHKLVR